MTKYRLIVRIAGIGFVALVAIFILVESFKFNTYDSQLGTNILFVSGEGMGIVGLRPSEDIANLTMLPNNLQIQTDKGNYQIEALWKVGLSGNDELPVLQNGVAKSLGLAVLATVKSKTNLTISDLAASVIDLSTKTNLSIFDRIKIYFDLSKLKDKGLKMDLTMPQNVLESHEDPDGKKILTTNAAVYNWAKNQWGFDQILEESAEISVINASSTDGVARLVSHQLETAGVRVVDINVSENKYKGRCIFVTDGKHPKTVLLLEKAFGCQKTEAIDKNLIAKEVKTDITMVLGDGK